MTAPRLLILEARFYDEIADPLLRGALAEIDKVGGSAERITVSGIFELPAALAFSLESHGRAFDGYVTLGCAIKGETDHYEHISAACMGALMELTVARRIALGNGVLTVRNRSQAVVRADPAQRNFGGQAARACLRMIALRRELGLAE